MAVYRATATLVLEFDSEDGLVESEDGAREELLDYLLSGPSAGEFDVVTEVVDE